VQTDNLLERTGVLRAGGSVVAAWSFRVADLVAWRRRPGNGIGPAHGRNVLRLLARPLETYVNAIV
jgi:hypothetical protein